MAKDARQLAAKLQRAAKTTERVNKAAVGTGAQVAKTLTQAAMVATGVTPGKKLRAGAAVNVNYQLKGDTALLRLTGPAQLVNNPTKAHRIEGRKRSGRRRGGKKAITIGPNVRRYANHPGTSGKKFWQAAEAVIEKRVPEVIAKTHRGAWLREFTGG